MTRNKYQKCKGCKHNAVVMANSEVKHIKMVGTIPHYSTACHIGSCKCKEAHL